MSLIHDALKSMDAPAASVPLTARPPAAVQRPAWWGGVLAFAGVLGVGGLGWAVWQSQQPAMGPPPTVAAAPAPAVSLPLASPTVPSAPVVADAGVAAPASEPASVPVTPAPVSAAMPPVAKILEKKSAAAQHPRIKSAPKIKEPQVAAPAVDDTPVELRFARFVTAMKAGQTADAERELAALKERLPAGSLGLLRAQAWFDLKAGRDAAAADGYRAILERLPGDEEAAINMASIQSRQLRTEEARATLDDAARLQPDSAALRAALAQFTPTARP